VRRSIEFFENQYRGINVSRLVLGGGMVMLRNLPESFEQELRLPVETIDPLRQIRIGVKNIDRDQVQAIRYQLGVGIGLAMRGLAA
jgi:Tfp pilus assembly PilM family ATPase